MVDFELMESESWYTITGVGGDEDGWKQGYQDILDEDNIGTIQKWVEFTGADMNAHYGLTDENAYQDDLHFLAFPLNCLDVDKLAIVKIRMSDRWFDDIVANNASRQKIIDRRNNKKNRKEV